MALNTIHSKVRGTANANSVIIAVGGGKGGVGKSFLSSNLGIFLANMGFNTVLVDLDLGAPNLHTSLGEPPPKRNFHELLSGEIETLEECATTTQFPKLRLITGANDHKELANMNVAEQSILMSALFKLNADFTILDLSAGTHTTTLDFFLMADRHIIALTPDPTSIENAYRFMKAAFFRKIKRFDRQLQIDKVVASLMDSADSMGIKVPADLLNKIAQVEPVRGAELKNIMNKLRFDLVINQTRSMKDAQLGQSIQTVCSKYFGTPVHYLGHMDHDNAAWHALRKRKPLILEYPHSPIYSQALSIARDLASPHLKKAVV